MIVVTHQRGSPACRRPTREIIDLLRGLYPKNHYPYTYRRPSLDCAVLGHAVLRLLGVAGADVRARPSGGSEGRDAKLQQFQWSSLGLVSKVFGWGCPMSCNSQ